MSVTSNEHETVESMRSQLEEASGNCRTVLESIRGVIRGGTVLDILKGILDTVRRGYGWTYGACW